jgi:hypothetical protein
MKNFKEDFIIAFLSSLSIKINNMSVIFIGVQLNFNEGINIQF